MRLPDLESEMFAAAGRVRQPHLDRMKSLGVSPTTIATIGMQYPAFGVVFAEVGADGLYQPAGGPALICQPIVESGMLIDLVAWHTIQPDRWWLRTGQAWAVNADDLGDIARWGGEPPSIYRCPLDWLRAGGRGSVVLDWSAPEIANLRMHSAINCWDAATARTLRQAIKASVHFPTIRAGEMRHAA